MKNKDMYRAWTQSRRRVDVDRGFSERVMGRIARDETRSAGRSSSWVLIERMGAASWAKAAAVGFAALISVVRALLTLHVLFSA